MSAQPVVVGGTYDWFLDPASINTRASPTTYGPWDLTGATVEINFMFYGDGPDSPPSAAGQTFGATVLTALEGTAHYINSTTLFDEAGVWGRSWRVTLGGTVLESEVIFFRVKESGAAA